MKRLEALHLNESYQIDVIYAHEDHRFKGTLHISPHRILITFTGEQTESRRFPSRFGHIDSLRCESISETYFLYNLTHQSGKSTSLSSTTTQINHFEHSYSAQFIIHIPSLIHEIDFQTIKFHSNELGNWINETETQRKIILSQNNAPTTEEHVEIIECEVPFGDKATIQVKYELTKFQSYDDFKAGITFEPKIIIFLNHPTIPIESKNIAESVINLMSFLIGHDLRLNLIQMGKSEPREYGSLYFPQDHRIVNTKQIGAIFPLAKDLLFPQFSPPPLPLEIFNNFAKLEKNDADLFERYYKYRRHKNIEDKFLGFFRLLETLCFETGYYLPIKAIGKVKEAATAVLKGDGISRSQFKDFVGRLEWLNTLKYNTEACIRKFFSKIPDDITSTWAIDKTKIKDICDLRNNLSHANPYSISDYEFEVYCKFTETLLILSLGLKIGIPLSLSTQRLNFIDRYYILKKLEHTVQAPISPPKSPD